MTMLVLAGLEIVRVVVSTDATRERSGFGQPSLLRNGSRKSEILRRRGTAYEQVFSSDRK